MPTNRSSQLVFCRKPVDHPDGPWVHSGTITRAEYDKRYLAELKKRDAFWLNVAHWPPSDEIRGS